MIRRPTTSVTVSAALDHAVEQQRALNALKNRQRRERAARIAERDLALARAAARHIPVDELAEALGLSSFYVQKLLRRLELGA